MLSSVCVVNIKECSSSVNGSFKDDFVAERLLDSKGLVVISIEEG